VCFMEVIISHTNICFLLKCSVSAESALVSRFRNGNWVKVWNKVNTELYEYVFFSSVPFLLSLLSCRDSGTTIGSRSGIKSTQNSMTSSVS